MFFSKAGRTARRAVLTVLALTALALPAAIAVQPAMAQEGVNTPAVTQGGTDAPTPYTVDMYGITLPGDTVFEDNGDINIHTESGKAVNLHMEGKCIVRTDAECAGDRHNAAQYIGKNRVPWEAFKIDISNECVIFVQVHGYDEHIGGDKEKYVGGTCATKEAPFTGVEKWTPTWGSTCEAATFSHPNFRIASSKVEAESYTYQVTLNGTAGEVLTYTPGETISIPFADKYAQHTYQVTLWAHYANGKPFVKQQLGQVRGVSEACAKPEEPKEPEVPVEPKIISPNPPQAVDFCGTENDEIQIPSDTDEVSYTSEEKDGETIITAHAREGFKLRNGEDVTDTIIWRLQLSDKPCVDPEEEPKDPEEPKGPEIPSDKPDEVIVPPVVNKTPDTKQGGLANTGAPESLGLLLIGGALLIGGGAFVGARTLRKRAHNN